jgi:NAD(P)-dependent dehydrogenase (short-subunit alcohol dehydrogenase family)
MDLRLDNKVAVVTGGSKGIGRGIAEQFAASGAQVVIVSRKADQLEATAREIGGGCDWIATNVGEPDQAERCLQEVMARHGSIDVLINNAAANPYAGPVIDVDLPRWNKTFQVNVTAPLVWTQLAWNLWMREHGGSVVNISSVGGFTTSLILGVYDVTKAALIHLTKQLASELGPNTRVNCVAPGLIKTDFARVLWEGKRGAVVAEEYPLKRLGEPSDIAAACMFLATDASSWITGQTIVCDGGGLIIPSKTGTTPIE